MTKSSVFAKSVLSASFGLAVMGAAAAAQAQPYSNYDPCQREAANRGVKGALLGGAGGAVIGSQVAASGHRTDGSLLGGVLGALAGAAIGHSSAACNTAPPPPPAYDAPPPSPPPVAYQNDYYPPPPSAGVAYDAPPPRYADSRAPVWVYGRHGVRYRIVDPNFDREGCTLAEGPAYLVDGRIDRRFVRVCPDYRGRYHVTD